jgi:hypothetical protein
MFEKREQDLLRTEGGPSNQPSWLLTNQELGARVQHIYHSLESITDTISKGKNNNPDFVPYILEVGIIEDAKAKSHKKEVSNFFRVNKASGEIGLDGDRSIIVKVDSLEALKSLQEKTLQTDRNKYPISAIENITLYEPLINIESANQTYKLKMFNYQNYETNRVVKEYLIEELKKLNIEFKETKYSDDLIVLKLSNVTLDQIGLIKELPIYSVTDMPKYTINQAAEMAFLQEINKLEFDASKDYPIVGVLDSGIELNEFNKDWVIDREEYYIKEDINTSHGTFVSGIILYGDYLEGEIYTGLNGCKILDVPVISSDTDEDELVRNIRRAISKYPQIKIWNLSVSIVQEISNESFSDIATAIDQIQDEYDVIICKSAGNSRAFLSGFPKEKIHAPGDSVRAVVVGSISQKNDEFGFSKKDYPSPYTRIGRGPARIIKPDVVHYGGDIWKDGQGNFISKGVQSLNVDGQIRSDCGTSFSTPRVAAILAGLQNEIREEFDALTLKALLIHSADYGECSELDSQTKLEQLGFGKPKNVSDILYGNANEITLILRDTLQKGKFVDIMEFPFPRNLTNEGFYEGQVTVTLVYNPILKAGQGTEYCQSNLNVFLGTYEEKIGKDMEKRNVLNPIGRDTSSQNVLRPSIYSKKVDYSSENAFANERMLIDFGDKFYPVKKYSVDLSELTPANKEKTLPESRQWFLKVEGLYRDFIEKLALEQEMELSMEYCVVVTIKDPKQQKDVYSSVVQELTSNNFIHRDIEVKTNIRVQNDDIS